MPGRVFISHSSKDKAIVTPLAIHLVNSAIPVWYDIFSLELGDSLSREIFAAADSSDIFVLVFSQAASESPWVERELRFIIDKEIEEGVEQVIPLRLDETPLPSELRGRKWLSLQDAPQREVFDQLSDFLQSKGLTDEDIPLEHAIVPAVFSNALYLRKSDYERRLDHLRKTHFEDDHGKLKLQPEQFLLLEEEDYKALKTRMYSSLDNVKKSPFYTPALEDGLRNALQFVRESEKSLKLGLAMIVENVEPGYVGKCSYEFARILRSDIVGTLWHFQLKGFGEPIDFGKNVNRIPIGNNFDAGEFYGGTVERVEIFEETQTRGHIGAWVPQNSSVWRELDDSPFPFSALDIYPHELFSYIVPQMLYIALTGVANKPLVWDFRNWQVGKA